MERQELGEEEQRRRARREAAGVSLAVLAGAGEEDQ
jgi:hypothetical protein